MMAIDLLYPPHAGGATELRMTAGPRRSAVFFRATPVPRGGRA